MPKLKIGQELKDHFCSFYKLNLENGCWEWQSILQLGYGQYYYNYKRHRAHRFSWMLFNGPLDANLYVCHKCDNKKCINPNHLFLGTPKDNYYDSKAKGRNWINPSKLTLEQQQEILDKFKNFQSKRSLAREYKVSQKLIQNLIKRTEIDHGADKQTFGEVL